MFAKKAKVYWNVNKLEQAIPCSLAFGELKFDALENVEDVLMIGRDGLRDSVPEE